MPYADYSDRALEGMYTGVVGSNPTRDIDVCVRSVFVLSCAAGWSPAQGVLPTLYMIKKL
jgi:hypothetical protein